MANFVSAAEAVEESAWQHAPAPDKWSPAQIAEHLRLTYEAVLRELRGGVGMRARLGWWRRAMLRASVLRRVLRGGGLPRGVPAVREIRPGAGPFERRSTLTALRSLSEEVAGEVEANRRARVTHPFFGKLSSGPGLAVLAAHNRHHRAQLPAATAV